MITRVDGRRKGAEERGMEGGGGGRVRGSCDVPTQGYLILSVRGERPLPLFGFGRSKRRFRSW